jgi:GT2 family glycosyltransferase
VEYVLCADERWGFEKDSDELRGWLLMRPGLNKLTWNEGRKCNVDGVNAACAASSGHVLIINSDDQFSSRLWDEELSRVCIAPNPAAEYVIRVRNGTPQDDNGLMTVQILSRAWYEKLRYCFYPAYESMYADNDFTEHAEQEGIVIDATHLLFPHEHPVFDASKEWDEVYRHTARPEAFKLGKRILDLRRKAKFGQINLAIAHKGDPKIIALCIPGEHFDRAYLMGMLRLHAHLVNQGYTVATLGEFTTNVYITRISIAETIPLISPSPGLLLWIDDDNILSPEGFDQLVTDLEENPEASMAAGWCWIQREEDNTFYPSCGTFGQEGESPLTPFPPLSWPEEQTPREAEWTGFPALLMRYDALETVGPRAFLPIFGERYRFGMSGEDEAFCRVAKEKGLTILADPRVEVPHLKVRGIKPEFRISRTSRYPKKENPVIIGMIRARNEARWINRAIRSLYQVCEQVFVMDDHSTDHTAEIAEQNGAIVLPSPFDGPLDEPRDKNWMIQQIRKTVSDRWGLITDWIFCIDGDEELAPNSREKVLSAINDHGADCFAVRFWHLWDKRDQVRVDRWFSNFCRLSLFRVVDGVEFRSAYEGRGVNTGLHCGNAPAGMNSALLNVHLLHYGNMLREDRLRKYKWYQENDPHNEIEDGYRHLVQGDIPEVPVHLRLKHAGPLRLIPLPVNMPVSEPVGPKVVEVKT